jgi:hypothetical protein
MKIQRIQSKENSASYLLEASFMLGCLFNYEDEGDMFLRNVG